MRSSRTDLSGFHPQAKAVKSMVGGAVVANYASHRVMKGFGSFGMSFYLPTTPATMQTIPSTSATSAATMMSVEFCAQRALGAIPVALSQLQTARLASNGGLRKTCFARGVPSIPASGCNCFHERRATRLLNRFGDDSAKDRRYCRTSTLKQYPVSKRLLSLVEPE
jgi:hypothetical protein